MTVKGQVKYPVLLQQQKNQRAKSGYKHPAPKWNIEKHVQSKCCSDNWHNRKEAELGKKLKKGLLKEKVHN